jgi:DNA polymerase III alpha subunit
MTKTKTQTKVVKDVVDVKEEKKAKVSKGEYHMFLKLNDKTCEVDTNDIKETLLAHKPSLLKTSLTVKVTKGDKTVTRYLYLRDARRLFINEIALHIFVRNILMSYPNGR